jgi:isocitrate dehydrogenase
VVGGRKTPDYGVLLFFRKTCQGGKMTKDLAICIHGNKVKHGEYYLYIEEFLDAIV